MKRLLSVLFAVILAVIVVVFFLWQGLPILLKLPENYHLIVATWVMAGFTIVLAVFAIIQGIATWQHLKAFYKKQTWDRLRKHSEKLKPILLEWVDRTMVSSGKLVIEHGNDAISTLARPSHIYFAALWEHMKRGYKKYSETWEELEVKFKGHKENSENFLLMLEEELKRRVRLPSYACKGNPPKEWFHSLKCAEIVYSVLTGTIEANYYLKKNPPKISPPDGNGLCEMQWPRGVTTIAMTDKTECTVIEQAVTDLIRDPRMIIEGNKLLEIGQNINECLNNFRGQLQMLIGIIELGGILEGNCVYCQRLRLK